MKRRITNFFRRLRYAWEIVVGRNKVYCIMFSHDASDEHIFRSTISSATDDLLDWVIPDARSECRVVRRNIIKNVLDFDKSVILQYKQDGKCMVSYDCRSEEDFYELRNQEFDLID